MHNKQAAIFQNPAPYRHFLEKRLQNLLFFDCPGLPTRRIHA
jgi:hypothetical protein